MAPPSDKMYYFFIEAALILFIYHMQKIALDIFNILGVGEVLSWPTKTTYGLGPWITA